jgi:hypothetical protein
MHPLHQQQAAAATSTTCRSTTRSSASNGSILIAHFRVLPSRGSAHRSGPATTETARTRGINYVSQAVSLKMADSASIRAKYDIRKQQMHQFQSFAESGVGYGPFIVQRQHLCDEIIQKANPHRSVHISGCRGAGKTTLLHLLGLKLVKDGKTVFFFNCPMAIAMCRGMVCKGAN